MPLLSSKLVALWSGFVVTTMSFANEATPVVDHDSSHSIESTRYFISPSAHYLFVVVDYTSSDSFPLHQLFAIETKNPRDRHQVGTDLQGRGSVWTCELSPDELWLWADFNVDRHAVEPLLFRHESGATFEEITGSSDVETELNKCYTYEEARFFGWKKDSSGVYVTLRTRGHANANYLDVLAFYNLITHHATVLSPVFSIPTNADDALEARESAKETAQFWHIIGTQNALGENSIERDLNLIYDLLKRSLNSDGQLQLVAEEKNWLATRAKKAESEREQLTAERVKVLTERWLRLTQNAGPWPRESGSGE